jgi:hypothetical protein
MNNRNALNIAVGDATEGTVVVNDIVDDDGFFFIMVDEDGNDVRDVVDMVALVVVVMLFLSS